MKGVERWYPKETKKTAKYGFHLGTHYGTHYSVGGNRSLRQHWMLSRIVKN